MRSFIFLFFAIFATGVFASEPLKADFEKDTVGAPAKEFSSFVGLWYVAQDGKNKVYVVDGRKWMSGTMSAGIADKAKAMYGDRYAEFLDNIEAYKYFPLTIYNPVKNFTGGTVSVRFKALSGRIDRGAGIAFDIKQNGDYYVIRANPLENNIVAFRLYHGKRSAVKWIRNISTPSKKWHTLKIEVHGADVTGFLNGNKVISLTLPHKVSGKIGLWSKADSYVMFDDYTVKNQ